MNHLASTALLVTAFSLLPLLGVAQGASEAVPEASFTPQFEHEMHFGSLLGRATSENLNKGVSMEYIGTYRINPYLGLGAGLGVHTFHHDRFSSYFPLCAVVKGYLSNSSRVTPFGQATLGYGMAIDQKEGADVVVDATGGLSARGTLGIEIDIGRALGLMLGAGYQYQRAEEAFNNSWWWGGGSEIVQQQKYRRIHLQVGIKF